MNFFKIMFFYGIKMGKKTFFAESRVNGKTDSTVDSDPVILENHRNRVRDRKHRFPLFSSFSTKFSGFFVFLKISTFCAPRSHEIFVRNSVTNLL
jgi:hypothetical protein